MGGCQNSGPLLGPLNTRRRIIMRSQKGTMTLTTTHLGDLNYVPTPPNVPLLRALWPLFDGIWGILKVSLGGSGVGSNRGCLG